MTDRATEDYAGWLAELRRLAAEAELEWLISSAEDAHRPAYERGATPQQEFAELADMAEWRGCACSGGS